MQLSAAIDAKQSSIDGRPLPPLLTKLRGEDVAALYAELEPIAKAMTDRLPPQQRGIASVMQLHDPESGTGADFTKRLENVAEQLKDAKAAVDLHLRGQVLHALSREADAANSYKLALAQYEKDHAPAELQALCRADFGQLYLDLKDDKRYEVGLDMFQQARKLANSPAFTIACRCQEADLFRRSNDPAAACKSLDDAQRLLDGEAGQRFAGNHPLRAVILERQSWIALDQWQMNSVVDLAGKAMAIRNANHERNPRSLRWIVVNGLVPAMAEHFLGKTRNAIAHGRELLNNLDERTKPSRLNTMTEKQRSELREVRCSVAEWLATFYLLGDPPQQDMAVATLREAVLKAGKESSSQWQSVAVLRCRLCIALAVSGKLGDAQQAFDDAKKLVDEETADGKNDLGQQAFSMSRDIARAVLQLYATDLQTQQQGTDALKQFLLRDWSGRIEIRDRELLWFASELLFERGHLDKPSLAKVAKQLWILTEPARKSIDREITREYLHRYFWAAVTALEKSGPANEDSEISRELTQFRELVVPKP